ncbi:MAG: diacylglycerol kinase family protein [Clostridia bacterium]|nr:diacylglycerol kinase family protein [Clostridia bacterium]
MGKYYILFNPHAGNGVAEEKARELAVVLSAEDSVYDMTAVSSYKNLITDADADVIILGGDGTLNRFVNDTYELDLKNKIFICPIGTGNDFLRDLGMENATEPVEITKYLKNLPACDIDGKKQYFINGVGFGIDGYCCEEGDRQKAKNVKKVNYTAIAIKGLLFHFKSRKAKITVDGVEYSFKKAWLAPCMNGRYYGGGMMPTPDQDRLNEERTLSVMLYHGLGKLGALMLFPKIFKGEHVKKTKKVAVLTGKEIIAEFDQPCAAQIDGETVLNVSKCRFISSKIAEKEAEKKEAVMA